MHYFSLTATQKVENKKTERETVSVDKFKMRNGGKERAVFSMCQSKDDA